jgi:hypothetical protein
MGLALLPPYYLSILIFGSEVEREGFVVVWVFGFLIIFFAIICIGSLVAAFNYVVHGKT